VQNLVPLNIIARDPVHNQSILLPYETDTVVMDTRCTQAQLILGYVFEDVMLLEEALTAAGNRRLDAAGKFTYQGNASLGFLGDAILQAGIGIESRQMGLSKGKILRLTPEAEFES
jgi:hypothetical protein